MHTTQPVSQKLDSLPLCLNSSENFQHKAQKLYTAHLPSDFVYESEMKLPNLFEDETEESEVDTDIVAKSVEHFQPQFMAS